MIVLVVGSGLFIIGMLLVLLGKVSSKKRQPEYLGTETYDLETEPPATASWRSEYNEALESLKHDIDQMDIRMEQNIEATKKKLEELKSESNTIKVKSGRYISYSDMDDLKKDIERIKISNISVEDIRHIADVMRKNVQNLLRENMDVIESSLDEKEAEIESMKTELGRVRAALKSSERDRKISRDIIESELQDIKRQIKAMKGELLGGHEEEKSIRDTIQLTLNEKFAELTGFKDKLELVEERVDEISRVKKVAAEQDASDQKIDLQGELFQQQEIIDFIRKGMESMGKRKNK